MSISDKEMRPGNVVGISIPDGGLVVLGPVFTFSMFDGVVTSKIEYPDGRVEIDSEPRP